MKRTIIALAVVALAFPAKAQFTGHSNYIGLNLGGGLNTMTFSPNRGEQGMGLGFDAGLHYAHFFNEHIGLGFGLHYFQTNSNAKYNFNEVTAGLTHPSNPGVTYNLSTNFNNWKEHQNAGFLGIPVELFYRSALNLDWTFIAGVGAQFDIPLHGKFSGDEGTYSTTGTFPNSVGSYVVSDMPEHGFSTYNNVEDSKFDNLGLSVSVIADLGFRVALCNNWGFYFGIYGGYGLNNMLKEQKADPILVVNTANPSNIQYNGTFGSNEIDALHMLRVGVKVGIDLGWGGDDNEARLAAKQAAERAAAEKAAAAAAKKAAEKAAAEKAAAEKAAADKAAADMAATDGYDAEREAADRAAERKAALDKAAAERAAAERAAAEQAARAKAEANQRLKAINATVYFDFNATDPKIDNVTDLAIHALCEAMKADSKLKVTIYGHTDSTGPESINMTLGEDRAKALKYYMIQLGAPGLNISTVSRGYSEPAATNDTEEGRAKNRRATAVIELN